MSKAFLTSQEKLLNAQFQKGDTVKALATAQGMIAGELYIIVQVLAYRSPFGDFVDYILERMGQVPDGSSWFTVRNLHLLAEKSA